MGVRDVNDLVKVYFFGPRWDSGVLDGPSVRRRTPLGRTCFWCEERFEISDRGLWRQVVTSMDPPTAVMSPVHAECDLRSALGGVNHLRNLCSCAGQTETPYPGTRREEAREVLRLTDELRATQGLGPMFGRPTASS